jgi:hypothetical protein
MNHPFYSTRLQAWYVKDASGTKMVRLTERCDKEALQAEAHAKWRALAASGELRNEKEFWELLVKSAVHV